MARDFQKLSEVPMVENVGDNASVLVEVNGEIRRTKEIKSGGSIKTAIIRDSGYLNTIAGLSTMMSADPVYTYECINMTFEEAYETMLNGEPLNAVGMFTSEGAMNLQGAVSFIGTALGTPCIFVVFAFGPSTFATLYWTADGLSTSIPQEK